MKAFQHKLSDRTPIEKLDHHIFEEREARRDKWDEQGEHDNDLRYESMVDYESWLTDANQYDEREQE